LAEAATAAAAAAAEASAGGTNGALRTWIFCPKFVNVDANMEMPTPSMRFSKSESPIAAILVEAGTFRRLAPR